MANSVGRTSLKVRARMALSSALRAVPDPAVQRLRTTYSSSTGLSRRALGAAVSVLRHRPLEEESFTVAGSSEAQLVASDSRLARLIYWYGERGYEGTETRWWRQLCADATRILELGANIGYYTVQGALAAPDVPYLAVEANPEAADLLLRSIELNKLANIEVVPAAVVGSGAPESVQLALPDQERYDAPTGAYLASGTEGIRGRPATRRVTVRTVPAVDLVAGVDLLKLDIEGYEATGLDAVWDWVKTTRPTLVVEVLAEATRLRELIRELHAERYLAFAIGSDSLHLLTVAELAAKAPLPRYGSRDVILIPLERAHTL